MIFWTHTFYAWSKYEKKVWIYYSKHDITTWCDNKKTPDLTVLWFSVFASVLLKVQVPSILAYCSQGLSHNVFCVCVLYLIWCSHLFWLCFFLFFSFALITSSFVEKLYVLFSVTSYSMFYGIKITKTFLYLRFSLKRADSLISSPDISCGKILI